MAADHAAGKIAAGKIGIVVKVGMAAFSYWKEISPQVAASDALAAEIGGPDDPVESAALVRREGVAVLECRRVDP